MLYQSKVKILGDLQMKENLLHTPDGVRDIYGTECEQKHILENRMHKILNSYGYRDIETPAFEYFDVFGHEIGTTPSRELYKFFDREGSTLVLRPDFTPSIARASSKYFMEENHPIRLCYLGNTYVNYLDYLGRMKESTQMGAELIGDPGPEADAEVIAMVIEMLLSAGLKEFQISVGQELFFDALAGEAALNPEDTETLRELIRNKNSFGVEKLLKDKNIAPELRQLFVQIPSMFGGEEIIEKAEEMTDCEEARAALERLRDVLRILEVYGLEQYVSIDLGMMSGFMYYTGIIFRGYTYGSGDAIIKGGRYDELLKNFGKPSPAIGFVVVINSLLHAMNRQQVPIVSEADRKLVFYDDQSRDEAIRTAMNLRKQGSDAELRKVEAADFSKTDAQICQEGGYRDVIHTERGQKT